MQYERDTIEKLKNVDGIIRLSTPQHMHDAESHAVTIFIESMMRRLQNKIEGVYHGEQILGPYVEDQRELDRLIKYIDEIIVNKEDTNYCLRQARTILQTMLQLTNAIMVVESHANDLVNSKVALQFTHDLVVANLNRPQEPKSKRRGYPADT